MKRILHKLEIWILRLNVHIRFRLKTRPTECKSYELDPTSFAPPGVIYAWAFGAAGAVQCGFCIPGMVMSAKGLLDVNASPSTAEIKAALKGNLCRFTVLMVVGLPYRPNEAGNGGLKRGWPFLPSSDSSNAVSSLQMYAQIGRAHV